MSRQPEKQARAEAMLGELAELGLMVAKDLAVRVRECEDVDQAVALANAFQKASRVVRLTLALDFKLDRDAARAAREAEKIEVDNARAEAARAALAPSPARAPTPVEARKDRVGKLLRRLLWNEAEGDADEYDVLLDDLSARLDEAARSADFETLPIETLARRVIADMELSGGLTLSVCEAATKDAAAASPERRSSA
jgi:D-serine deaminase-like pyridoxal phosphate-dependent protein